MVPTTEQLSFLEAQITDVGGLWFSELPACVSPMGPGSEPVDMCEHVGFSIGPFGILVSLYLTPGGLVEWSRYLDWSDRGDLSKLPTRYCLGSVDSAERWIVANDAEAKVVESNREYENECRVSLYDTTPEHDLDNPRWYLTVKGKRVGAMGPATFAGRVNMRVGYYQSVSYIGVTLDVGKAWGSFRENRKNTLLLPESTELRGEDRGEASLLAAVLVWLHKEYRNDHSKLLGLLTDILSDGDKVFHLRNLGGDLVRANAELLTTQRLYNAESDKDYRDMLHAPLREREEAVTMVHGAIRRVVGI